MRLEIRFGGTGGQGVILAGIILAEAAALYEGKNAVQTQAYGPEARGGASKSEVIISTEDIDYPKVLTPDIFVVYSDEAYKKYIDELKPGGTLIYDTYYITEEIKRDDIKSYGIPFTEIAMKDIGKVIVANIISLGSLVKLTDVVSYDAMKNAILGRVPKHTVDMNMSAFERGVKEAEALLGA
jgi:2-oxoglutarate ferredoxin oxidoreductase subunit gamma